MEIPFCSVQRKTFGANLVLFFYSYTLNRSPIYFFICMAKEFAADFF